MHYIQNSWRKGEGEALCSNSPVDGRILWQGNEASLAQVDTACSYAHAAQKQWAQLCFSKRVLILEQVAEKFSNKQHELADLIHFETGKAKWESLQEAALLPKKLHHSLLSYRERQKVTHIHLPNSRITTTPKPLGVAAVIGPYNFPMHIPNGQILPALLAGNSVLFKPSELTPACAEAYLRCFIEAGVPPGVLQLLQGGVFTGQNIVRSPLLKALFFTGSRGGGVAIAKALAHRPEVLLALEMGGNNPLYIEDFSSLDKAVELAIASCFISSGQRCTCARRILLKDCEQADAFIEKFVEQSSRLTIGKEDAFLGSLIHEEAANKVLFAAQMWHKRGAVPLLAPACVNGLPPSYVSPGIYDATHIIAQTFPDEEIFGPLVQIRKVPSLEEAVVLCNATAYGLSASIVSQERSSWEYFLQHCDAGIVNINSPTTGAYGGAAFGGIKNSGNMRPCGYYAGDLCSYPCVSQFLASSNQGSFLPENAIKKG